jgi:peptidoglycan-N-acetylglucosamine deacetylase
VRNSPWSAKYNGVVLGHLYTNYPRWSNLGGIIDDLHAQGLHFCRNTGPVGRNAPFPLACKP